MRSGRWIGSAFLRGWAETAGTPPGSPVRGSLIAVLLSSAALTLPILPVASPACAQERRAFDVAAGDLGSVLTQIGRAGGQTISFRAELTQGRSAGPIAGQMTVGEAVARALAGSGLAAIAGAHGSLIIRRAQAAAPTGPAPGGDTLVAIDVADLVGGTGDRGFAAGNTGTSDRLNIPLKENPRSVVGVTKDVIRAQGVTSILDAAKNVSNVTVDYGSGQSDGVPSYSIRGFSVDNVMIGGRVGPRGVNLPIADVERVDVIKGPTTDLTGQSLAGGGINIIPKMPTADPIREATLQLGDRFYRTAAFDLGGPVAGAEGLTYRINLSGTTADTAVEGDRSPHEGLVSPKMRWDDGETTVTAGARYFDQASGLGAMTVGNVAFNNRPIRIARDRPFGTAEAGASFRAFNPYIDIEHKFDSLDTESLGIFDFTIRNRSAYFANNYTSSGYIVGPTGDEATLVRLLGHNISQTERQAVSQSDLIVVHTLGDYRQTMRFGFDYQYDFQSYFSSIPGSSLTFDVRTPPSGLPLPGRSAAPRKTYADREDFGLAFQDKIDLFDRLHILGSMREDFYSLYETHSFNDKINAFKDTALTYNGGAVYDIFKWMSVYGSVGTGFVANQGTLANGQSAPPSFSKLTEYGFKFNFLDDRFRVTVARFQNDYSNVLGYDFALHGNVLGPGTTSSGLEMDVQGQLTDNISVIGGFGRTLIRVANAQPGYAYPGVPPYKGKLFAVYTVTEGALRGFQAGGGFEAVSSTYSSFGPKQGNSKIPSSVTFDAMLGYTADDVTLSLNIKNVFDHYYYEPTQIADFIPIGQGRRILAEARIRF